MTPLEGALFVAARGLPVFPVHKNRKIPATAGWQSIATTDEAKIRDWAATGCNFGVALEGYTVLDFDRKTDINGLKNFLAEHKQPLEQTLTVQTPSGGLHMYYFGETRNTVSALAKGVDTRSRGGFVVAPGSQVNGNPYQVVRDAPVAALPSWLAGLLMAKKEPLARPTDEAARGYITSGERNNALTRWAGVLRGQGLTRDEIRMALLGINRFRCEEPLPQEEVIAIADSIAKKPFKEARAIVEFTEEDARHEVKETPPLPIADFLGTPPTRKWIIPEWLPEGETASLYGAGSTGKSLLSLQLGTAVSTGGKWLGLQCEKTPVMYVACEDTKDELHMRCARILASPEYEFSPETLQEAPFFLWSRVGRENDLAKAEGSDVVKGRFYQVLDAAFTELHWKRGLLILDTVSDVYLGSEIDRSSVNKFIKTILGSLKLKYNLTILFLAHPSRSGTALRDGLSGSTAWDAAVRCRWWLRRNENDTQYSVLERVKSNYSSVGERLNLEWVDGCFRPIGEMADPLVETLFMALEEPGEHTLYHVAQVMFELAPVLGNSPRAVERKLEARLLREKEIAYEGEVVRMDKVTRGGRTVRVLVKEEGIFG